VNPDNPTGGMISRQELRRFLHELEGISTVLLDEAYAEYAPAASLLPETNRIPNLIRLRSFSKIYGLAGARIGYAIADAELVRTVEQLRQRFGVSKLSNAMASAALESQEFISNVASRTALGRLDYEKLAQKIGARPLPSSANFVAFRFPTAHQAKRVAVWLEEGDILVSSPMDPPLDQLVRVTVGPEEDRRYLAQVLSHLPSEVQPLGVP
jgi:histidinol-phosphate aminotransferase